MRISPIIINQYKNNNIQRSKTNPGFQAQEPVKSQKIFQIIEYYNKKCDEGVTRAQMKEYLKKEFGNLDMNERCSCGDVLIIELMKKGYSGFMSTLGYYEDEGVLGKINWKATDYNGDNILVIMMKSKYECGSMYFSSLVSTLDYFAKKGKFDMNAVNRQTGETPLTWAIKNKGGCLVSTLAYSKTIDMMFTPPGQEPPIIQAIKNRIKPYCFKEILTHPSMDISKLDMKEIIRLVKAIPVQEDYYRYRHWDRNEDKGLDEREIKDYIDAVETAIAMQSIEKLKSAYDEEGVFTLNQIDKAVNQIGKRDTISSNLNELNENIGHFFAETYINPKNAIEVKTAENIAAKLRKSFFHFGNKDSIGRTPLMIALEGENFVVAKAILKNTHPSEIKYCSQSLRTSTGIWNKEDDTEAEIRALIENLEPEEREEFTKLLDERLKDYRQFR